MKKKIRAILLASLLFGGGVLTGNAIAEQGHMDNAATALQNAIDQLNQATPNKGGHRERAIGLTRQALDQVEEGIVWANTHR